MTEHKKSNRILYNAKQGSRENPEFQERKREKKISCLDKKCFDKKHDKDKIQGYVHLKNKKYSDNEYGTLVNTGFDRMDIYSKKKLYQGIVGYIHTEDDEYLAVTRNYLLLFILLLVTLIAAIVIFCWFSYRNTGENIQPSIFDQVVEEEDDQTCDLTAKITLPYGDITFNGIINIPEKTDEYSSGEGKTDDGYGSDTLYTGEVSIRITKMVDEVEKTILDTTIVKIENGQISDTCVDFTKLDFELNAGSYDGLIYISYEDGYETVDTIKIIVVDTKKGHAGIGFSDQVYVYRDEERVVLKYASQEATSATIVQVILKNDDNEVLLAQSGIINSGNAIYELPLRNDAKEKLRPGSYAGIMRIYLDDTGVTVGLKTDIEVTVNVQ